MPLGATGWHGHRCSDLLFPGGVGKTGSPEDFTSLLDDTWLYLRNGDDSTLGEQKPTSTNGVRGAGELRICLTGAGYRPCERQTAPTKRPPEVLPSGHRSTVQMTTEPLSR